MIHIIEVMALLVGFIFSCGVLLQAFLKVKTQHWLMYIAWVWLLGHAIILPLLYILALTNSLDLITTQTRYLTLIAIIPAFVIVIKKLHKPSRSMLIELIFFALLMAVFVPLAVYTFLIPLRGWDAIAIWFLKAKSFYFADGVSANILLNSATEYFYSNKVYPIGIPLIISTIYRFLGEINDQIPKFYLFLNYGALAFALIGFIRASFPKLKSIFAYILGSLIIFMPNFLAQGVNGYVDISLTFFITLSFIFVLFMDREKDKKMQNTYIISALLCAVLSSFIKGEGMVFAMIIAAYIGVRMFLLKPTVKPSFSYGWLLLIPSLIAQLMWYIFTKQANLSYYNNYLGLPPAALSRIKMIILQYTDTMLNFTLFGIVAITLILVTMTFMTIFALKKRWLILLPGLIIACLWAAYSLVYFFTPLPLDIHLSSSYPRLFVHILPLIGVYMIFLASHTKEVE